MESAIKGGSVQDLGSGIPKGIPIERVDRIAIIGSLLLLLLSSYRLFTSRYSTGLDPNAKIVGSLSTTGTVKWRHAKSLGWDTVSGNSPVYVRDMIYTPKDTIAEFHWGDNQSFELEPESMVQFDEVTQDHLEIQLLEGKIRGGGAKSGVVVKKKSEPMRIIPIPKPIVIKKPEFEATRFEEELTAIDTRLNAELEKQVKLLRFAPVKSDTLDPFVLSDFDLFLIAPVEDKYNLAKNKWLKMRWFKVPVSGISYQLEISRESSFQRFVSHKTNGGVLSIQFEDPGQYFWRVKASNGTETILSNQWVFTMLVSGGVEKSSTLTANPQSVSNLHEIATDKAFENIVRTVLSTEKKCNLTGLPEKEYFCRIVNKKTGDVIQEFPMRNP